MTHSLLSRLKLSAITLITLITVGCGKSVDDERVPYSEVHISFTTVAEWNLYGVKDTVSLSVSDAGH